MSKAEPSSQLSSIEDAIDACRAGRMLIIVDDEDRENEGDLMIAAEHADSDSINFMATHGRGLVCLAMQGEMLDRLKIPMMVRDEDNGSGFGTGFTLSVEAAHGVTTGISTEDRAHTIRTLIDPTSTADDIVYPGHIFPLRARDAGVLERRGQTEASVDLARLAGLKPAGVICEVLREDGRMMRLVELLEFARRHALPVISVEQLAEYRKKHDSGKPAPRVDTLAGRHNGAGPEGIQRIGVSELPTAEGEFRILVYRDTQGLEHTALVRGNLQGRVPLVRLHSECLTGDAFGSLRCDCGEQLKGAMREIVAENCGIILYLRQEGRGIGLGNKIRAYALQDRGRDTVDANRELGFPDDARQYDMAAAMLHDLGVSRVRLLSNNPEKRAALARLGVAVDALQPLLIPTNIHNEQYLRTKAERMGHRLMPANEDEAGSSAQSPDSLAI